MKIKYWVATDKVGSKKEYIIEVGVEWDEMSDIERDAYIWNEITNSGVIEYGYEKIN